MQVQYSPTHNYSASGLKWVHINFRASVHVIAQLMCIIAVLVYSLGNI